MKSALVLAALAAVSVADSNVAASSNAAAASNAANISPETIWDDFKHAVSCAGCETLIGAMKLVADLGEKAFINILTDVCDISGTQDKDVCSGLIAAQGPALHYSLKNMHLGSQTSKVLCSHLFGLCEYPAVRPFELKFPSPKPATARPPPSGQRPIQVAHVSDTHVDLEYTEGSNAQCSKPICCRSYTAADAPGNTTHPCGPWGDTKCDPPLKLEESMVNAIDALDPAFSIYTGDVVAHDLWRVTEKEVHDDFDATFHLLSKLGLVYAAVGNHDSSPVNLFPSNTIPSQYNNQWSYDAMADEWAVMANTSTSTAKEYGSYSAIYPGTNLRIISYNSVFYYKDNFWMYEDPMEQDPNGQLAWLISELQAAETAGQRAWLISHVPSGSGDHFHDHSHYIDQIVNRYEATIAALFFGHTHTDLFQVSYSDYAHRSADTATAMGYVAASLTPTSGPPTFRTYAIDPVTFGVLDYTVYIANISDPSYQTQPKWEKYYTAKEAYGARLSPPVTDPTAELTPAFWHDVTALMEKDDSVFQAWWQRTTRGFNVTTCTGDCASDQICGMRGGDAQYNCVYLSPGFHFEKRNDDGTAVHRQEQQCEDGLGRLLKELNRDTEDFAGTLRKRVEA